jgi:hypothetical protein
MMMQQIPETRDSLQGNFPSPLHSALLRFSRIASIIASRIHFNYLARCFDLWMSYSFLLGGAVKDCFVIILCAGRSAAIHHSIARATHTPRNAGASKIRSLDVIPDMLEDFFLPSNSIGKCQTD